MNLTQFLFPLGTSLTYISVTNTTDVDLFQWNCQFTWTKFFVLRNVWNFKIEVGWNIWLYAIFLMQIYFLQKTNCLFGTFQMTLFHYPDHFHCQISTKQRGRFHCWKTWLKTINMLNAFKTNKCIFCKFGLMKLQKIIHTWHLNFR